MTRSQLQKYPATEILVELSEYPLGGEIEKHLDLSEFGFVYEKGYFNESLAQEMNDRPCLTIEESAIEFAQEAEANEVKTFEYLNSENKIARQSELNSFIDDLMKDIPGEIEWLDPRHYHDFKQKTKIWVSVDALVIPQSDALHVVVYHMLPPGGLLFKEKNGSGWTIKLKDLHSTIWLQRFAPNKTVLTHSKIDEDSILIIEIKKVVYVMDDHEVNSNHVSEKNFTFENVGMAILNLMMPTGELANGHYQLPLVKEAIDFAKVSEQLDGEATALDITEEIYDEKFKEGNLLEHSSIYLSLFEENFPVVSFELVYSENRPAQRAASPGTFR